jgi:hypothetical protein
MYILSLELEVSSTFGRVEGKYLQLDEVLGSCSSYGAKKINSKYYFKTTGTIAPNALII